VHVWVACSILNLDGFGTNSFDAGQSVARFARALASILEGIATIRLAVYVRLRQINASRTHCERVGASLRDFRWLSIKLKRDAHCGQTEAGSEKVDPGNGWL